MLNVHGKTGARQPIAHKSGITVFTYGFDTKPAAIPASGWTRVSNQSDQPHFVSLQHVKANTTGAMVRKFIRSGGQGNPTWLARGVADSGVVSPGRYQYLRYHLPAGKYLLACFWPDKDTGMPHFFMGMWKLVELR
jgi:hypothetical protein